MIQQITPYSLLLVSSRADPAGTLIHEEVMRLLESHKNQAHIFKHQYVEERLIYLNGQTFSTDTDAVVFLSRHASVDPRAVLTVHVTGNFGDAQYGGDPGTLTPAVTPLMHAIMHNLARFAPPGYEVSYEATHHGPTGLSVPSCFVEVGSTEKQWADRDAAHAAARAVIEAVPEKVIALAGFGGTHYAKRQTDITLTTRGGFGHIMPTRDLIHLTEQLFCDIVQSSSAEGIYIDKKSLHRDDQKRIELLAEKYKIPVVGQSDLYALKDLPFTEYQNIVAKARSILPDCSITIHNLVRTDDLDVVTLPADLLAETVKSNGEQFIAGISSLPLVHLSGDGQAVYHSFITHRQYTAGVVDELIHLCVSILQSNAHCRIDGDYLIITKTRFNPDAAVSLGVSPGPDFRALMDGSEIITAKGVIKPDMVMEISEKKIRIAGWGDDEINS